MKKRVRFADEVVEPKINTPEALKKEIMNEFVSEFLSNTEFNRKVMSIFKPGTSTTYQSPYIVQDFINCMINDHVDEFYPNSCQDGRKPNDIFVELVKKIENNVAIAEATRHPFQFLTSVSRPSTDEKGFVEKELSRRNDSHKEVKSAMQRSHSSFSGLDQLGEEPPSQATASILSYLTPDLSELGTTAKNVFSALFQSFDKNFDGIFDNMWDTSAYFSETDFFRQQVADRRSSKDKNGMHL